MLTLNFISNWRMFWKVVTKYLIWILKIQNIHGIGLSSGKCFLQNICRSTHQIKFNKIWVWCTFILRPILSWDFRVNSYIMLNLIKLINLQINIGYYYKTRLRANTAKKRKKMDSKFRRWKFPTRKWNMSTKLSLRRQTLLAILNTGTTNILILSPESVDVYCFSDEANRFDRECLPTAFHTWVATQSHKVNIDPELQPTPKTDQPTKSKWHQWSVWGQLTSVRAVCICRLVHITDP